MNLITDALYGNNNPVNSKEARLLVANRVRQLRLQAGWSQVELAKRAGFPWETYRRFESDGHIQLDRLCRIVVALGRLKDFSKFLEPLPIESMEALEKLLKKNRKRGHTL